MPICGIVEVMDHLHQPVFWRNEIRIEDRDELAGRSLQPRIQRSRFVAVTIFAMHVDEGWPSAR